MLTKLFDTVAFDGAFKIKNANKNPNKNPKRKDYAIIIIILL